MLEVASVKEYLRDRVNAGVEKLDVLVPDWASRIDVELLDMHSCSRCVLGQVFGHYAQGVAELEEYGAFNGGEWGFDIDYAPADGLADAWLEESKHTDLNSDELYWQYLRETWLDVLQERGKEVDVRHR